MDFKWVVEVKDYNGNTTKEFGFYKKADAVEWVEIQNAIHWYLGELYQIRRA